MVELLQLEITKNYPHLPNMFKNAGKYYLDLPTDFAIRTTETLEGSDLSNINVIAAYPAGLQVTDRNSLALEPFLTVSASELSGTGVEILITRAGEVLPFRRLYVDEITDTQINVRFEIGETFWTDLAAQLPINQIKYNNIDFRRTRVLDYYNKSGSPAQSTGIYEDGHPGICFPSVWYGKTAIPGKFMMNDLRPFFYILDILRRGFKQIGWYFRCPVLETTYGRRLAAYLLKSDYGSDTANNYKRQLSVSLDQELTSTNKYLNNHIPFNEVISDPSGAWVFEPVPVYKDSSFYWEGAGFIGEITYKVDLWLDLEFEKPLFARDMFFAVHLCVDVPAEVPFTIKLDSISYDASGVFEGTLYFGGVAPPGWTNAPSALRFENTVRAEIPTGARIYVRLEYGWTKLNKTVLKTAELKFNIEKSMYSEGDIINPLDILDPKIDLLSLMRATAHLINGSKVYYNLARKELILFSPYSVDVFGNTAEGFFKDDYVELDVRDIQPRSLIKKNNYQYEQFDEILGFATSTDPAITQLKDTQNKGRAELQIFDSKFRRGRGKYKGKIEVNRNPLFEPTINKAVPLFVRPSHDPGGRRGPVDLPHLTDNNDRQISFNINPRVLVMYGTQGFGGGYRIKSRIAPGLPEELLIPGFSFEGFDTIPFYAFNYPNMVLAAGNTPIQERAIYGIEQNKDFYTLFYKRYYKHIRDNIPYEVLAFLDSALYKKLDFRKKLIVNYDNTQFVGQLFEKRDFDGGISLKSTPVVFYPIRGNYEKDLPVPDPGIDIRTNCDTENLNIEITKVGNTYTATLVGTSSNPIDDVEFYYRTLYPEGDWMPGNSVSNPVGDIQFQMVVKFEDDCPDYVITKTIYPCNNTIVPRITYDGVTGCLSIDIDMDYINSPVDTIVIKYRFNGEGVGITYTGPICDFPDDTTFVEIGFVINFTDGCSQVVLITSFAYPPTTYDCSQIDPGLLVQETPACLVLPQRTGDIIFDILVLDIIQYRYDENDQWATWDENTPLNQPVFLRRVVISDGCDPKVVEYEFP